MLVCWPVPALLDLGDPVISSGPWLPQGAGDRPTHNGADIMYRRPSPGDPQPPTFSRSFQMPDNVPALAVGPGIVRRVQDTRRGTVVEIGHTIETEERRKARLEQQRKESKFESIPALTVSAPIQWVSTYRHLQRGRALPKVGQEVAGGDVVGIVGGDPALGAQALRHLHYELTLPWPEGEKPQGEPGQPRSENVFGDPATLLALLPVLKLNAKSTDLAGMVENAPSIEALEVALRANAKRTPVDAFRRALIEAVKVAARKLRELRGKLPKLPNIGGGLLLLALLLLASKRR